MKESGVDTKTIYSINSISSHQNIIWVRFCTQHYQNQPEQLMRSTFNTHKHRIARAEGNKFPGQNKPDMSQIKEELCSLYNSMCTNKTLEEKTWTEHIYCTYIRVHGRDRKSYIQFTDPTHPNNPLQVFKICSKN